MAHLSISFLYFLCLLTPIPALHIATSLQWIEHTPQPYAIKNFYKGTTTATLTSGGIPNLASDPKIYDLAANAETQGLKQYTTHKNLRLIYIICEVAYRIVADKRKGITKLSDLKGKKIGSIPGTSANVFVHNMLSSVGIKDTEYTLVSGNVCMKTPCAGDTLPAQISSGAIDAFGVWEPAVQLGVQSLGSNAVVFQNASVYREVYALYSTTDALADKNKRKDIVEFVRALNQTAEVFGQQDTKPSGVFEYVAKAVGMDASVVKAIWGDHKWSGRWGADLIEFLVEEDGYLAAKDGRGKTSRGDLEKFLDTSVLDEV